MFSLQKKPRAMEYSEPEKNKPEEGFFPSSGIYRSNRKS
jgi:hypothetical protein